MLEWIYENNQSKITWKEDFLFDFKCLNPVKEEMFFLFPIFVMWLWIIKIFLGLKVSILDWIISSKRTFIEWMKDQEFWISVNPLMKLTIHLFDKSTLLTNYQKMDLFLAYSDKAFQKEVDE